MGLVPWATLDDLPAERPVALPGGDEQWSRLLVASSEVLYALTGRMFAGERTRTIDQYGPCSSGGDHCRACRVARVRLPNRDARELLLVEQGGVARDLSGYRIARGGYLERSPGSVEPLPTCGTPLRIRYRFGRAPSAAGTEHALALATALAQATTSPDSSPLPAGVTQIVRQGITFTQRAASELIALGQTGLPSVDVWVATVNPHGARRPGRSWSPDTDAPYYPIEEPEEAP